MSEQSISNHRHPPTDKKLVSSVSFPVLDRVFLEVWRWPGGKHVVMNVHASPEACPTPKAATHAESADTLRLAYPSASLPPLEWDHALIEWRWPATHALHAWSLEATGKPKDWLLPETTEAVFIDESNGRPALDLRASLIAGRGGPAPLPEHSAWPQCPACKTASLFSQSLDFRDMSFAHLLPGTTGVIFFCEHCHQLGEWESCSTVIWLAAETSVVVQTLSGSASLRQCVQYYGPDAKDRHKMPALIREELDRLDRESNLPCIRLLPSYGTKAGGNPSYLQSDPDVFDRTGGRMEYIGQIATPEYIPTGGFGYIFYSVTTKETQIIFQDT